MQTTASHRTAEVSRKTRETDIRVSIDLDGTGRASVSTGIGFFDHMLELFAKHSLCDLEVECKGDLHVDYHHAVEDCGLALGTAIDRALGDRRGIRRYGFFLLPMDESLCRCAVDFGGRPYLVWSTACTATFCRDFDTRLFEEFFRALSTNARMNVNIRHEGGNEPHHAAESVFKAFARSVRAAAEFDPRETGVPSSKGTI
ncbi:MAG: imidazoleglycerol-phosphate dehydratase HisB [Kiritimatiellae bacterium]|nr:imidazoleglycerol-phosphate dehydratase HisB [Kiritimatiellia bacterium]MBR1837586.1 imidazoleglycerol-phosphate dehydratase HisB [Kiritimatiellia bacterium]